MTSGVPSVLIVKLLCSIDYLVIFFLFPYWFACKHVCYLLGCCLTIVSLRNELC